MVEPAWFTVEQQPGLQDFWRVYDTHFGAIADGYEQAAPGWSTPRAETHDRIRRAVAGDWDQYAAYLRGQGARFAHEGLSFATWHTLAAAFTEHGIPLLIHEYGDTPARLTAALLAMHHFANRAMATLGDAYAETVQAVGRAHHANAEQAHNAADRLRAMHAADLVFRTMVDSVTDYAIFMLDPGGRVATWNRGAERLKGYAADEIIGTHFSAFYTADDNARDVPAHELRLAIAEGRSELEGWRVRRDGSRFWANVVISAMRDDDGGLMGFTKVTRDLTARKAAETALAAANRELEAFSYSVAHDLRAPLRGMNGFAQLLLDRYGQQFDEEGQDWLNEILLNAGKMAGLIDALLSLSRVTRTELKPEPVDLSGLATEVAQELADADPGRRACVVIEPGLRADMDLRLARALLENLLGNAWKFASRVDQPRIDVGRVHDPATPTFFVRDNGAGFDMAYAAKLFAPFRRLHTVAEFPGTGIGLATVQRIVHRHGGRVWGEGAVGKGATFTFTVPHGAAGATP